MSADSGCEGVERRVRTLARESGHIVAFRSSDTTFRAAGRFPSSSVAGSTRLVGKSADLGRGWILPRPIRRFTAEGRRMTWTDERVENLKKLWGEGLSASQIAAELGGITRNAVIGKVHRLGLSGRAKSTSSATPRPRKARTPSHMLRIGRATVRGNTALAHAYEIEAEVEPELIENIIPIGQRRTILELNEQTCRWPVGDPGSGDFFFCG